MRNPLIRRGLQLEYATLGWNVIGVPSLAIVALESGSAAAAGFGLDSAIEIGASLVVVWELTGARGKAVTGRALGNPVLQAEGRVTLVDAALASAVLVGLSLNAALGWWWADPIAGLVIVVYALHEGVSALRRPG